MCDWQPAEQESKSSHVATHPATSVPAAQPGAHPRLVPSAEPLGELRETVSGFSRYSNLLKALPPQEKSKIETLARRVVAGQDSSAQPIRRIQIIGHADLDTPRRPAYEKKISLERARRVRTALAAAIERLSATGPSKLRALPPYSTRVQWDWSGVGATQLVVPAPASEADRARNRRVEIILTPLSRHQFTQAFAIRASTAQKPIDMWKATIENEIHEFCSRIGQEEINRHNCAAAVNHAARILGATAPKPLRCNLVVGGNFVDSKNYHSPLHEPPSKLKCCTFNAPCDKEPYASGCGHCAGGIGPYLILQYHPVLAKVVEQVRCVLDRGCLAVAGVLSGICDDKPDAGCARKTRADLIWKECPEHWLLIIGYADDPAKQGNYTFVFWDSARMSPLHTCGHEFGLLYYNRQENRLSTAPTMKFMDVDKDGYHPWPYPAPGHYYTQKRYQVLKLGASGPYRDQARAC